MPYRPRRLQVPERLPAADDLALLLLGVGTGFATPRAGQHLGRPARQRLGDRLHGPLLGTRHPDREGRRAHDPPAATPGKRPGRKMTFLSFTTSWSFRESCTACESTLASSARPRAFTSSSASSPTRMWNTSCKMTGPASSCTVTKCAVHPETRTPSSHACL